MREDDKKSHAEFSEETEASIRSLMGEVVKKLFTAGVGAAFMTEESIRRYLKDVKLPGEAFNTLLQGANRSKEDLMNAVTDELVHVIKKIDFVNEASRFVEEHKFRISAEIEVVKKDSTDSSSPSEISTNVKMT